MKRHQLFWEVCEILHCSERKKQAAHLPRQYGTEDWLYMREIHTIQLVGTYEGLSLNELVDKAYRTKPTMSLLVNKLEKQGFIRKEKDYEDRRRTNLFLTKKGQKVFQYHDDLDQREYGKFLKDLTDISDEELATTQKVLARIIEAQHKLNN